MQAGTRHGDGVLEVGWDEISAKRWVQNRTQPWFWELLSRCLPGPGGIRSEAILNLADNSSLRKYWRPSLNEYKKQFSRNHWGGSGKSPRSLRRSQGQR